jgi:hypothetical protein
VWISRRPRLACASVLVLLCACARPEPPLPTAVEPRPPPAAPTPLPAPAPAPPPCSRILHLEIRKVERTLLAHCARGAVVTMVAAVGREPAGTKQQTGDLRTPEGRYRIAGPAQSSRFHAFVPFDYPSVADADRGLAEGRIDADDHRRILAAHARGELPPQTTPLGGNIGLHGEGARWAGDSQHLDWTLGCVAVRDADLDFLIERIDASTSVEILP